MKQQQTQETIDYIIIGAGLSGLQSAQILTSHNKKVLILEAQEIIGGRVQSQKIVQTFGDIYQQAVGSKTIQKGATWIQEGHTCIQQLCKELGVQLHTTVVYGEHLYLSDKSYSTKQFLSLRQNKAEIVQFLDHMENLADEYEQKVLSNKQLKGSQYQQLLNLYSSMSVEQFLQSQVFSPELRQIVNGSLEHTQCADSRGNSMHQVLVKHARSRDLDLLRGYFGLSHEEECDFTIVGGSSTLVHKLMERILCNTKGSMQDIVKLGCQVIEINNSHKQYVGIQYLSKGITHRIKAKHVFCSIPIQVLKNIHITNISQHKQLIFNNQIRTTGIKVYALFKSPFWRELNKRGQGLFSSEQMINMSHDLSPPDKKCGIIVFFINGRKYQQWKNHFSYDKEKQKTEKTEYIKQLVKRMFQVSESEEAEKYRIQIQNLTIYECSFNDNIHIRTGFQSNTSPGTFKRVLENGGSLKDFYSDEQNLSFIGSEFSQQFASYMQGAIRVGRKKTYQILGEKDPIREKMGQQVK